MSMNQQHQQRRLSDIIRSMPKQSIYARAAEHFSTSYNYVHSIAIGRRIPQRGKGKQILDWLTNELKKQIKNS